MADLMFIRLPEELKELTLGYVHGVSDSLNIRYFDEHLDALTASFKGSRLVATAEKKALESNTFVMDGADTTVEWITPDVGKTTSRRSKRDEAATMIPRSNKHSITGLNFTPHLFSLTEGQISTDVCKIRHLEVRFALVAEGTNWDDIDAATIGEQAQNLLKSLPKVFPKLQSLDVVLDTVEQIRPSATYSYNSLVVPASRCPLGVMCEREEKARQFLAIVESLELEAPQPLLRPAKTLTFARKADAASPQHVLRRLPNGKRKFPSMRDLLMCGSVRIEF